MAKRDFYEILGIDKNASEDEIKKSYRKLSKKFHPDVNPDNEETKEKFQEIAEAYEHLSDPSKRAKYDQFGHGGQPQGGFNNNEDLNEILRRHGFNMGGFGMNNRVRFGHDLTVHIKVTLEEIHNGTDKKFTYRRDDSCKGCSGKGGLNEKTCSTCNGQGRVGRMMETGFGTQHIIQGCPTCEQSGRVVDTICNECEGKGIKSVDETIELSVPSGINDGATFIMEGKGAAIKNGISGKLHIVITELPHDKFIRQGNDLKYNLKLNYSQLVLGDKVEIPTIDGKKIRIPVPEFNEIGQNLRVNNKGLKILNKDAYGDLIIILDIEMPKKLSDDERKLITKLMDINKRVNF